MSKHRATIQWSSLINAKARSALSPVHLSICTHTVFYGIHSQLGHAQDNIHTLHQAWQTLQADGVDDKHREKKLAEEKKKRTVCVSMCLNCTHVRSGPCQSSSEAF